MAGTPCPNCKSFMTKFGDQFMCKKCGTIIDSCSLQHNSSQIQKKQNCHKYKNDYVNLAKEIKSLTIETHKKIIDLSTLLGGDIEIEEVSIDINEKNFQVSILKNIDQFTTEINETHEMLYSYVSNICKNLEIDHTDFNYPTPGLLNVLTLLFETLSGIKLSIEITNPPKKKGVLEEKKYILEVIKIHLTEIVNILNTYI